MKRSEKTKMNIIKSAVDLFYKKGFDNTTTKEIAKNADISEASVFKYFSTKKNLLIKSLSYLSNADRLDMLFKPVEDIISSHKDDSIENLLIAIIKNREMLFQNNFKFFAIIITESRNHSEILPIFKEKIYPKLISVVGKIFKQGIDNGEIDENINIDVVLRSWLGSVFFMFLSNKLFPKRKNQSNLDIEIKDLVNNFLNGIRKES